MTDIATKADGISGSSGIGQADRLLEVSRITYSGLTLYFPTEVIDAVLAANWGEAPVNYKTLDVIRAELYTFNSIREIIGLPVWTEDNVRNHYGPNSRAALAE